LDNTTLYYKILKIRLPGLDEIEMLQRA